MSRVDEAPPRAAVLLAEGFEETEAVTVIDVLRRAGVDVRVLGLHTGLVTGSHGITLASDARLDDEYEQNFDLLVLPGGQPGSRNLAADPRVIEMIRNQDAAGRLLAAICAAPGVLSEAGVLRGRQATGYPGEELECADYVEDPVVQDAHVITSRGVGTALEFGLALVERLRGRPAADEVRRRVLAPPRVAG